MEVTDNVDISYKIRLMSETANLFSKIKGKVLRDINLSEYDHTLDDGAVTDSWDTQILQNGILIPFQLGRGYVYPLHDGAGLSYRTGDSKDIEDTIFSDAVRNANSLKIMNSLTDFVTLKNNNSFVNPNRYTDTAGGQAYND